MKKSILLAAPALVLASCASDAIVDEHLGGYTGKTDAPIGFITNQKNITRSQSKLQDAKHYNFGVFAYKSTETVNNVMANYLVGYMGTNVGYYMTEGNQTTLGDDGGLVDGKSMWQYEKLGSADYTYGGGDGYYRAEQTEYMSNVANQYLRYWDMSAPTTAFYAYAPYINTATAPTVTYVDGTAQAATGNDTYVMCFPDGTITDGYDQPDLLEFMYASTKVVKADYGHDVSLNFQRLNAKVNIKFWEDIEGYSVRILDLKEGTFKGVQAAASIKDDRSNKYGYRGGKYYSANGAKIQFGTSGSPAVGDGTVVGTKQFKGTEATNDRPLEFAAPTDAAIGENRVKASASATTYYAIPKGSGAALLADTDTDYSDAGTAEDGDFALTGFTFHVSYELTSDTGERIVVKNATVHVPANYANWMPNTHYTYIFKITKNSNGSTDPDDDSTIDPTDPEVPTEAGLYPIVFDNCTITDYDTVETEHEITEGTKTTYYDVKLSTYSLVSGDITVTVVPTNAPVGETIDMTKITVTGPGNTDVTSWYTSSTITVPANAAPGIYTVTYTCHTTAAGDGNHPNTWTEHFVVGSTYAVSTNLTEVGTHGLADAALAITAKQDGDAATITDGQLYIEYPENLLDPEKALVKVSADNSKVEVSKNAKPGTYKLVYSVDEGSVVKVAEQVFTVVDYQFALNNKVVYLDGAQTVKANKIADDDHVYTVTGDFTVTGNCIAVPANTSEGTYVVTYTLYGSPANANAVSKVQYNETFEVRNVHAVALNATAIDRSTGTSKPGYYSTDVKTITTKQNGSATTADLSDKLSIVKSDNSATASGDFKITYVSDNKYELTVKNNVAAGNYRVKFVSTVKGADAAEYFDFVVTE